MIIAHWTEADIAMLVGLSNPDTDYIFEEEDVD